MIDLLDYQNSSHITYKLSLYFIFAAKHLRIFLFLQKIRTIELDGKTIKLQIVSTILPF